MFGKMRLLVGCRSGMTVKFASKFHHGNPFVRGACYLLAVRLPLRGGRCAVRRWCGIGCMRSPSESAALGARLRDAPWGLAHSVCVCAGIAQERFPCVARCMDAPRTFCVAVLRLCTRRALSAVLWRPAHSARICAAPSIVALALCGGRKRQENYTASRPFPRILCFASTCLLGATPARRGIQRGWMPGSPGGRCTGRRRANWSWCS